MAIDPITGIAQAISEGFKLISQIISGKDRAKLVAAVQAAESYIFVNEKNGQYFDISEERKKELLVHFRKRFFSYNQ